MTVRRRAVFLDRDGVLNRPVVRNGRPHPPAGLHELEIPAGVSDALRTLREAGFALIVVTNQPDVARGTQRREHVEAINAALLQELPLDDILVCYHDDADNCACRKPRPGLLIHGAEKHKLDLFSSFLIGDRWKDVEAGDRAGCSTILLGSGWGEEPHGAVPDYVTDSLLDAAAWILTQSALDRGRLMVSSSLKVKLFADGADKPAMLDLARHPLIRGFTTNPTLMRKAGVTEYRAFALDVLEHIADRPISFEVFADEFAEMGRQAREICTWGRNVYVKIPVTNTRGESAVPLVRELTRAAVKVNVTALLTLDQVRDVSAALVGGAPAFVSVFAGRIADTGRDPVPLMAAAVETVNLSPNIELIWASPRELLNIIQADAVGCHVITATPDILKKLDLLGKDLHEYSLETVKMFREDAVKAGYTLERPVPRTTGGSN